MMLNLFFALGAVILLIFALKWILERVKRSPFKSTVHSRSIYIVEIQRLDDRRALYLIQENGMEHLLLIGHQSEHVIHTRPMTVKQYTGSEH